MKWFSKTESKKPYTTYEGIARITQINDTIVALDKEILKLSEENTEIYAADYDPNYRSTPKELLMARTNYDTAAYIAVQTKARLAVLEVVKQHKTALEQEAKHIMQVCSKD